MVGNAVDTIVWSSAASSITSSSAGNSTRSDGCSAVPGAVSGARVWVSISASNAFKSA